MCPRSVFVVTSFRFLCPRSSFGGPGTPVFVPLFLFLFRFGGSKNLRVWGSKKNSETSDLRHSTPLIKGGGVSPP